MKTIESQIETLNVAKIIINDINEDVISKLAQIDKIHQSFTEFNKTIDGDLNLILKKMKEKINKNTPIPSEDFNILPNYLVA